MGLNGTAEKSYLSKQLNLDWTFANWTWNDAEMAFILVEIMPLWQDY